MINGGFMRRGQLLDGCTVLKDYDIKVIALDVKVTLTTPCIFH
jgi:hypothetical protein